MMKENSTSQQTLLNILTTRYILTLGGLARLHSVEVSLLQQSLSFTVAPRRYTQ